MGGAARAGEPDRQAGLRRVKITALVRDHFGVDGDAVAHGGGAAVRDGSRGWYLVGDVGPAGLGSALLWARAEDLDDLHVLADDGAGVLARRACAFASPPTVWAVDGREIHQVGPEAWEPVVEPPDPHGHVALLREAGLLVHVEDGSVRAEVTGVEVARVVGDERLEVGVGERDRQAFALMHAGQHPEHAVRAVVDEVRRHRAPGAPLHPLNRFAPEGVLREVVTAEPSKVGLASLEPIRRVCPVVPGSRHAVGALGTEDDGTVVVLAFSVGIDPDLVPTAADLRAREEWTTGTSLGLRLVLPTRDAHPATRDLAASLVRAAEVVTVSDDWRS